MSKGELFYKVTKSRPEGIVSPEAYVIFNLSERWVVPATAPCATDCIACGRLIQEGDKVCAVKHGGAVCSECSQMPLVALAVAKRFEK